jgi:hypothetical protein
MLLGSRSTWQRNSFAIRAIVATRLCAAACRMSMVYPHSVYLRTSDLPSALRFSSAGFSDGVDCFADADRSRSLDHTLSPPPQTRGADANFAKGALAARAAVRRTIGAALTVSDGELVAPDGAGPSNDEAVSQPTVRDAVRARTLAHRESAYPSADAIGTRAESARAKPAAAAEAEDVIREVGIKVCWHGLGTVCTVMTLSNRDVVDWLCVTPWSTKIYKREYLKAPQLRCKPRAAGARA